MTSPLTKLMHPTYFPEGVSNRDPSCDRRVLGMPDPSLYVTYFDDFCSPVQDVLATTPTAHTITEVHGGTGDSLARGTGTGGELVITTANNSADGYNIQAIGTPFLYNATLDFLVIARFKVSNATNSKFFVGLAPTSTTAYSATSQIGFIKNSATTTVHCILNKVGANGFVEDIPITNAITCDTAYHTYALEYRARANRCTAWLDNKKMGYVDLSTSPTITTIMPTVNLTPTISMFAGTAASVVMTLDHFGVYFLRSTPLLAD